MMHAIFFRILSVAFPATLLIITVFSLTTLIVIILHWRNRGRSVINLLTCNSCVGLLFYVLSTSFQIPIMMRNVHVEEPDIDPIECTIYGALITFAILVLAFSFSIQVISRFFINILYKYKFLTTLYANWILIIGNWFLGGFIAACLFISPNAYEYELESHICCLTTHNVLVSFISSVTVIGLNITIMCVLYGIIFHKTMRQTRVHLNRTRSFRIKRNAKVFKRIFIFMSIFGYGSLLYVICSILNYFNSTPWILYGIAHISISTSCALNAMTIFFTNDQVKDILLKKLRNRTVRPLPTVN